jgi:phosphoribosylformylglycinamidine cyclo-ligase
VPALGATVGDALLAPHRSYLSLVRPLLDQDLVKGLAHITGGGITENLPRILPAGVSAEIRRGAWKVPPLFTLLQAAGGVADDEVYRAFNMGIGMIVACADRARDEVLSLLVSAGEHGACVIGQTLQGNNHVVYV